MKINIKLSKNILLIPYLLIVFSGCSHIYSFDNSKQVQYLWPSPPSKPRYRYITTLFSSKDIELKDSSDHLRELVTGQEKPGFEFKRPLDIATYKGRLYVLDSSTPIIHVFDLNRRKYFKFGYRLEGKLVKPVSIHISLKGTVYVADRGRNSIIIFDEIGLYRKHISLTNIATQIAGITTDSTESFIYAVDRGGIDVDSHQILKFGINGNLIQRIGQRGKSQLEFNLPMDIVSDSDNNLYILDAGNFRIQVIDSNGNFIRSWGSAGNNLGNFGMPRSIAADLDNNIYVSDAQFGNIQIFSSKGNLLMHIGNLSNKQGPGHYTLITGITLDHKEYLYVLDQYTKKLDVYKKLTEQEQLEYN